MITKDIQKKILDYCESQDYVFSKIDNTINIVYIEGMNKDGSLNSDTPNCFNDLRTLFNHKLECIGVWEGTTEPGSFYTNNPMNRKGAARIKFGQYTAWKVGQHGKTDPHEGLVQVAPVTVHRDFNKDGLRLDDTLDVGLFGINQHWGYDLPVNNLGKASAGCLVGRTRKGHREFMSLVKSDARYLSYPKHIYSTIIIPGDKL